jgi:hypothetical protein
MKMALPEGHAIDGWRRLYAFAVGIAMLLYVTDVFVRPIILGTADVVIHDDARQFLAWMPRLLDPHALQDDWMADYWESVTPPAYQLLYRAAAGIGLAPTLFARLLPLALFPASAWAAWRLAAGMGLRPPVIFCAAAFVMALLLKVDSIFSATPRGVAIPILLYGLHALVRERWLVMAACLVAMATIYPSLAVVGWTMLGLSRLRRGWRLADGWSDVARLGASGAVILALLLLFREQAGIWGPVLTLEQARDLPGLMTPGARSAIVGPDGEIDHLCSMRMGFMPEIAPCDRGIPLATLFNFLCLAPMLWLAAGSLRGPSATDRPADRLYLWALGAAALWFVIATIFAFRLHLPSRYSQNLLYPLEWLAIGQLLGQWLHDPAQDRPAFGKRLAGWGVGALLLVSFLSPLALLRTPDDPAMIRFIRTLPPNARISGVSTLTDYVPALTGRAVEGSPQHAIPWHLGYYRRVMTGLDDSLTARLTSSSARLQQALARSGGTHILIARQTASDDVVPAEYEATSPVGARTARRATTSSGSLLPRLVAGCRVARTSKHDLVSTGCVLNRLAHLA